jgi:abequosyltransferase
MIKHDTLRFSICIPQYNRVGFLIENLNQIAKQSYHGIEICISDDCSTDNTEETLQAYIPKYKYPIRYERFVTNQGYDRNLRRAMEMATGDYIIILGNDDTINPQYDLLTLAQFITDHYYPEIGFTNYLSAGNQEFHTRAHTTDILGQGPETAFAYYSCFSFIGGIVIKRQLFIEHNTAAHDGSIYGQMYFSTLIISGGGRLFSIREPVVIKDILPDHEAQRVTFLDHIPRQWKDYKRLDGGLHAVINVVLSGFRDSKTINQRIIFRVFQKIYTSTLPFWIVTYRRNGALPAAIGLISGLRPWYSVFFCHLSWINKGRIIIRYILMSTLGLIIPFFVFDFIATHIFRKTIQAS